MVMPDVVLEPVGRERRLTFVNLFQLYAHDFSEQWFDRPEGELNEDGRLEEYSYLDNYWSEPRHEALLIRADGRLAGFCLVNDHSHCGLPLDFQIAEFFVARKHRRSGIGQAAALAAIGARPGQWRSPWRGAISARSRSGGGWLRWSRAKRWRRSTRTTRAGTA